MPYAIALCGCRLLFVFAALLTLSGCSVFQSSQGGGQNVAVTGQRVVRAGDVALPPEYTITAVATGLNFPTGVCFDDQGGIYVTEAGGGDQLPRLLKINPDGSTSAIASGTGSPWNGVVFHQGNFYLSEGGADAGGRILKITPSGQITPLVEHLPSQGEYHTNGLLVAADGYVYFGQGSATNSGVAGADDYALGWVPNHRQFHDIAGADMTLTGLNVETPDPEKPGATTVTGAYSPLGAATVPGQTVPGQIPCTGSIMRVPLAGGAPELVAWGFRDPFGLALDPSGELYATEQSYEDRGSRPVAGCGDMLWMVNPGVWYGWPDFYGDRPLKSSAQFAPAGKPIPQPVLAKYPNNPPKPAAYFAMHAGAAGMDFSRDKNFGHPGEAFVAEFGDLAPFAGDVRAPVGFDVVRVDPGTGVSHVFAANKSGTSGPASKLGNGGLERPIAARFDSTGTALYVVDYGIVTVGDKPDPHPGTGVLWKITIEAGR